MKNEIMRLADEFACYISNGSSVNDQGRRAALESAVENLKAENAGAEAVNKAAALEIVSLRSELDAAKADAQRYRWLRERDDWMVIRGMRNGDYYLHHELDAAIDAAMEATK